jgi:hypothetical protein
LKDKKLWEELIRLLPVEGQPTKALLAHVYGCVFNSFGVSYNFRNVFLPKPPGQPPRTTVEKHCIKAVLLYEVTSSHVGEYEGDFSMVLRRAVS